MYSFNPAMIGQYFAKEECELTLFLDAIEKQNREKIVGQKKEINKVQQRLQKRGNQNEIAIINNLKLETDKKRKLYTPINGKKHFSKDESIELLKDLSEGFYYQITIEPTLQFYKDFNIDPQKINFTICHPDLILVKKVGKVYVLHIIDIKSSLGVKLEHKIQVILYAILLQYFIKEYNINAEVDMETGSVWREIGKDYETFNLSGMLPNVHEFLKSLTGFSEKTFDNLLSIRTQKCEWCDYYKYCDEIVKSKNLASGLPYLSSYAQKKLYNLKIYTLEQLKEFIQNDKNMEELAECYWFKQRMSKLPKMIDSFLNRQEYLFGNVAIEMPIYEDIKIILTAQKDQVTQNIVAAAIVKDIGWGKPKQRYHRQMFIAKSEEDCSKNSHDFVNALYSMLKLIDKDNKKIKNPKSVQVYVMDNYERNNILEMIQEQLPDKKAQQLLFYFHNENLGKENKHPGENDYTSFPIVVLTSICTKMFALPCYIAYNLTEVSKTLLPKKKNGVIAFPYKSNKNFTSGISNIMKPNIVYYLWEESNLSVKDKIKKEIINELRHRMGAAFSIINGIRDRAKYKEGNKGKTMLIANASPFILPEEIDIKDPFLSRLAFMWTYEALLDCDESRKKRTTSREQAEIEGIILNLTCEEVEKIKATNINGNTIWKERCRFRLNNKDVINNISEGPFPNGILGRDSIEVEKAFIWFNDYHYKEDGHYDNRISFKGLYYAAITEIDIINDSVYLNVEIPYLTKGHIIEGENYIYAKRSVIFHFSRTLNLIKEIDRNNNNEIVRQVFFNPFQYHKDRNNITSNYDEKKIDQACLSKSQRNAFEYFLKNFVSIVWGPPGTGKTHFLAMALLLYIMLYNDNEKPFKILVTSNTHKAIENCLSKLLEFKNEKKMFEEISETKIVKLYSIDDKKLEHILIEKRKIRQLINHLKGDEVTIIGVTTAGLQKLFKEKKMDEHLRFDAVVIDEASQMTLPMALSPIYRLSDKGRLMIVGDNIQLPPIIKGEYNFKNEKDRMYFGGFFQYFKTEDIFERNTSKLLENFRMCEGINAYPRKIYGDEYKPFNTSISNKKIVLSNNSKSDRIIDYILNPNYPVVLGIFEDIPAGKENPHEAELIADLIKSLYDHLIIKNKQNTGNQGHEDRETTFWQECVSGVCPYHVQIRAIKKILMEKYKFDREKINIGTVDALQGAEREIVITSYGGVDGELAEIQPEFIYGLERLNVSITRAMSKNIIFIPKKLFEPSLRILNNEKIEPGIAYMLGLREYVKQYGDSKVYQYNGKKIEIYRR
jgi:hypothetical protein